VNKTIQLLLVTIAFTIVNTQVYAAEITECSTQECTYYFDKFKAGARRGHVSAVTTLGEFYYHGFGTKIDKDKGFLHLKKAARHGNVRALYKTGLIYLNDKKYKNLAKGIKNLERVATKEFLNSAFLLGIIHMNRDFGFYNNEKADKYLAKAYKSKHPDMPQVVDILMKNEKFDAKDFPKLLAMIKENPITKDKEQKSAWPQDDIEIISIKSPSIKALLNEQIIAIRRPVTSLGSRLPSYSCKARVGCYSTWEVLRLKDFTFF
jgi:hypothetical protein